jgi:hypothetical protein
MGKVRITTLLSLTGVLVAGSAAALVNTQVLGNPTPRPMAASEITAVLTLPTTTVAVGSADSSVPTTQPDPDSAAVSSEPAVFDVEGVGTVTLDGSGEVLRLVSATSTPGWTVTATTQIDPTHVKVTLQSLDRTVHFTANLDGATIATAVSQMSNVSPSEITSPDGSPEPPTNSSPNGSTVTTPNTTPSSGTATGNTTVTSKPTTTSPSAPPTTSDDVTTTSDDSGSGKGKGKGGGGGGSDDDDD